VTTEFFQIYKNVVIILCANKIPNGQVISNFLLGVIDLSQSVRGHELFSHSSMSEYLL